MEIAGEENVRDIISYFFCERDKDVESFLREKATIYDKVAKGRTYLIVSEDEFQDGHIKVLAYFTLALKSVTLSETISNSRRKKLDGLYKNTEDFTAYLIGQLGKNDLYKNEINGSQIIDYALNIVIRSFTMVGGRFVLIECNDNEKLIEFYNRNGFEVLQKADLVQMIRFLV